MKHQGISMIEVLIAILILGTVLTALLRLTVGSLTFSAISVSTAERLQELNDATSYVADNLRRAKGVETSLTVNGQNCDITSYNCLAVVIPASQSGSTIDTELLLVYRLEPRSSLGTNYKVPDSWADANTLVLMEYRKELCGGSTGLSCPQAVGSSVTGLTPYFVVDQLATTSDVPDPLNYDGTKTFTLRFQVKDQASSNILYTPQDGPSELKITRRN